MKKNKQSYNDVELPSIPVIMDADQPTKPKGEIDTQLDVADKYEKFALNNPQLPERYNSLSHKRIHKALSKQKVYGMIEAFTPYMIQNLLYLGANPNVPAATRVRANQVLLNKVLPDLSAEHIKIDNNDMQSLVIVKAGGSNVPSGDEG